MQKLTIIYCSVPRLYLKYQIYTFPSLNIKSLTSFSDALLAGSEFNVHQNNKVFWRCCNRRNLLLHNCVKYCILFNKLCIFWAIVTVRVILIIL